MDLFKTCTQNYGIPSNARCDYENYGIEDVLVGQFMLEQRVQDMGSIITESTVHNCRVERTHSDVFRDVLCFYATLFSEMDFADVLDPLNDLHFYCLCRSVDLFTSVRVRGLVCDYSVNTEYCLLKECFVFEMKKRDTAFEFVIVII